MDENERARAEINAQTDPRDIFEYPPLPFPDGVKISIELSDETALVPLTNAYAEVLLEIFKHGGISESQAKGLVDCLLDWADSDDSERVNGAEQNHYDRLTPRVAVPNRALRSFDELYHIKDFALTLYNPDGTPNEIWKLFRSLTTLHSHSKINLNTASPKLLEILAERGEFRASQVEDHRNGSDGVWGTRDDEIIQKLEEVNITASPPPSSEDPSVQGSGGISHLLGIQCELLRLRITASRGDSKFILSVLLKASGSKDNAASFTFSKLQENRAIE